MSVRQVDVTHCVCTLRCDGLFLTRWPLLLLFLDLFGTLRLLALTAQLSQLLILLWGKNLFRLMVVQVLFKPDGGKTKSDLQKRESNRNEGREVRIRKRSNSGVI